MKGFKVLAIALLLMAVASATMAADASNMDAGKQWTLTLLHPTRVGSATLKAGDYNVRHVKEGEQHFLAFSSKGKEVARVSCKMEQLPQKAQSTELTEQRDSAGERTLTSIAFKNDSYRHELLNR
jgi:hypothetical protein